MIVSEIFEMAVAGPTNFGYLAAKGVPGIKSNT